MKHIGSMPKEVAPPENPHPSHTHFQRPPNMNKSRVHEVAFYSMFFGLWVATKGCAAGLK